MYQYLWAALRTQCQLNITLKVSFLVKISAIIIKQGLYLAMWAIFFNRYVTVRGWGFSEMLAMYGLVSFSIGIVEAFFYGIRELPMLIESGQLDNYLIQPRNILLNVALSKGDVSGLAEAVYGLLLFGISGYFSQTPFLLLLLFPMGIVFMFSLYLYVGNLAFFMGNAEGFIKELLQGANIIIGQPSAAYSGLFKVFTLTLLPTAYLCFFPIEFLRTRSVLFLLVVYLGTILFLAVAVYIFYRGLRRYESGGGISQRN